MQYLNATHTSIMPTFVYLQIAREAIVLTILKINRADRSPFAHMTRRSLNAKVQGVKPRSFRATISARGTYGRVFSPSPIDVHVSNKATNASGPDQDSQLISTLFEQIWSAK